MALAGIKLSRAAGLHTESVLFNIISNKKVIDEGMSSVPFPGIEKILITDQLYKRPAKPADFKNENKALLNLASELANGSQSFLDRVVESAKELTFAHTAGITLRKNMGGNDILVRQAVVGKLEALKNTIVEREHGPALHTISTATTQLYQNPEKAYPIFKDISVPIVECLIVPIVDHGQVLGFFWAMSHDESKFFDSEDARILNALSDYVEAFLRAFEIQNQLASSEKMFRAMFDNALIGFCIANPDGKIQQVNPAYCKIVGYSPDELTNLDFYSITHQDDREKKRADISRMLRGDIPSFRAEKRYIRKDSSHVWVQNNVSLVRDIDGNPKNIIALIQDVTEEKKLQSELNAAKNLAEVAKNQAEIASLAKSQFLANMSHEIRTPLGAILGFITLLEDLGFTEEQRQKHLQIIRKNGIALSQLVDDILDLSKVEMGHLEIEVTEFSLQNLLEEVEILLSVRSQEKAIQLEFTYDGNLPNTIVSDATRLRQILINTVGNAIKFTDRGKVNVSVKTSRNDDGKDIILILVKDTGIGLTSEQKQRLFRPFSQADSSMFRKYGGTGLGLDLSRRLARALGGDVTLQDSFVGRGSTFAITIASKLSPEVVEKISPLAATQVPAQITLEGVKVLLVEDSADNQTLIKYVLGKYGADVDVANNGLAGIQAARNGDHDMILMDIQMPEMDGYEATSKLRSSGYTKPIVAITAHAMKEERLRCMQAGCNKQLTKPINFDELVQTVNQFKNGSSSSKLG